MQWDLAHFRRRGHTAAVMCVVGATIKDLSKEAVPEPSRCTYQRVDRHPFSIASARSDCRHAAER